LSQDVHETVSERNGQHQKMAQDQQILLRQLAEFQKQIANFCLETSF